MTISIIACVDCDGGIGKEGVIPWVLKPDMPRFRLMTLNHTIIMGRKTWESIGSKPLPGRTNIVLTSNPKRIYGADAYHSLGDALKNVSGEIYIIGGSALYTEGLAIANNVYLTRINQSYSCDTFFPLAELIQKNICHECGPWSEWNGLTYRFETYH